MSVVVWHLYDLIHSLAFKLLASMYSKHFVNLLGEEEPCTEHRKEKLVMVECEGFATVVMSCDKTACSAVFGDGTVIKATHRGEYQVQIMSIRCATVVGMNRLFTVMMGK